MARHPRVEYAGAVYHVTSRGQRGDKIAFMRSQAATQRDQRYRDKLREDPVAWEAHLKRKRIVGKRVMERKRKDPKAWKAHLKRRRVYLRSWRRRQRESAQPR